MKILYFHQHFSTPEGSTGTRSYEMARFLTQRGHTVTVVSGSSPVASSGLSGEYRRGRREGAVDGFRVIEFNLPYHNRDSFLKRIFTFGRYAMRSVEVALREDYDLVFASSTPLTAGIPGIAARLLRRKPFVFEVRDLWPELPREMGVISNPVMLKGMDILEWLSYHLATGCIGLSPGIVQGIVRRNISPARVAMVPNGCDLQIFTPEKAGSLRPEGTSPDDFLAIFSGVHGIANGLHAVLDAGAELQRRGRRDIKLLLLGEGKLKPELMARAERKGITQCLFLDTVPKKKLARLLAGVDCGLMILANVPAFYYGTSPNKFFDYISAGLPVLNNYPGWLAELITNNKCGIAVPPENPQAFADALEYLADHRETARVMGRRARELAEREFARHKLGAAFADALESFVGTERKLSGDAIKTASQNRALGAKEPQ